MQWVVLIIKLFFVEKMKIHSPQFPGIFLFLLHQVTNSLSVTLHYRIDRKYLCILTNAIVLYVVVLISTGSPFIVAVYGKSLLNKPISLLKVLILLVVCIIVDFLVHRSIVNTINTPIEDLFIFQCICSRYSPDCFIILTNINQPWQNIKYCNNDIY